MRKPSLKYLLGALLLSSISLSSLAADREFQIDLIVFANNNSNAAFSESWPDNLRLRYPNNWVQLPGSGGKNNTLTRVDAPSPEFANVLKSMRLSSRYRTLFQGSWRQTLKNRRSAPAILIQGGDQQGEHYELEGYVKVAVERYLYLDTNLWFSRFGDGKGDFYLPRQPYRFSGQEETEPDFDTLTARPEDSSEYQDDYQQFVEQNPQFQEKQRYGASNTPIARIVVMDQLRRLRSNEVHFLDHPLFGVLVMITNVDDLPPVDAQTQISP